MPHHYTQIKAETELTWRTVVPIQAHKGRVWGQAACFSLQSRQICLAGIMVAVGIGAYNDFLLDRPGAYRQGDWWIRVAQSSCAAAAAAAASLLWPHHKDVSEQWKGH